MGGTENRRSEKEGSGPGCKHHYRYHQTSQSAGNYRQQVKGTEISIHQSVLGLVIPQ